MAGDHKCPVCGSTFTRSQHVARHMRSHTGDRPYKCSHCGDQFARSDLLSRHVNKCHSADKLKAGAANNRRKGRASSSTSAPPRNASQPFAAHYVPQHSTSHSTSSSSVHAVPPAADPYGLPPPSSSHYSTGYASHRSSFDNSQSSSYPSSVAGSNDSLGSIGPTIAYNGDSRRYEPFSFGQPTYPEHDQRYFRNDAYPVYKEAANSQQSDASEPVFTTYNDLPTPLGYPSKQRTNSHSAAFNPGLSQSDSTYGGVRYDPNSHVNAVSSLDANASQPYIHPGEHPIGEGGFSSAFGLMSLDDPNVLAGVHSGIPFFDNSNNGIPTPQGLTDLHALLQSNLAAGGDPVDWNALMENQQQQQQNSALSEKQQAEAKTLREIWSAFLRDPTTGLKPDGTEKGKISFPTPGLHRRSSSYSGLSTSKNLGNIYPALQALQTPVNHSQQQQEPFHNNNNGAKIVAHLEAQAARDHGRGAGPSSSFAQTATQQPRRASQHLPAPPVTMHIPETLRGYEEAVLARKAPVLKMPVKGKTRDTGGPHSASSVLPTLSNNARAPPPGGVASLAGSQLPSAAAASAVPLGLSMNQGLAALQQHGQRPVLPMPKPRSRPSTATGHYPETSPVSATSSGRATPAYQNHSEPPSRPGTSAGRDGSVVADSRHGSGSAQSSPPNQNIYTMAGNTTVSYSGRPSTAGGVGGIAPASESRPGTAQSSLNASPHASYANVHVNSSNTMAQLQPSSNTFAPYIQYASMPPPSHSYATNTSISQPSSYNTSSQAPIYSYDSHKQQYSQNTTGYHSSSDANLITVGNVSGGNRPSYKRLASQILEPAVTKRPHIRRGDTAEEETIEDEDEGEDSVGGNNHAQQVGGSGPNSTQPSRSTSGSSSAEYSVGSYGAGAGSATETSSSFASYRRMSEPSSMATRMYPRPPPNGPTPIVVGVGQTMAVREVPSMQR